MNYACRCGKCELDKKNMDKILVTMMDEVQALCKFRIYLSSGIRCKQHNAVTSSTSTSSHLKGKAVDIIVNSSRERFHILAALIKVGFNRIGIGKTFIHADIDLTKPANVIWTY